MTVNTAPRSASAIRLVTNGVALASRHDFVKAVREFRKAADDGDAEGQYQIGMLYARGQGVVRSFGDAMTWFSRAAEQGHAEAQYQLGLGYLHGGQADDWTTNWFNRAAAQDQEAAERNRVLFFPNGIALEADHGAALRWCREAAEQGLPHAMANLALMYARGLGGDTDYQEAKRWYLAAAEHGLRGRRTWAWRHLREWLRG